MQSLCFVVLPCTKQAKSGIFPGNFQQTSRNSHCQLVLATTNHENTRLIQSLANLA